ncbi:MULTISPECIES: serine hydroxymethyltransferase [unclassified Aureimonas]
MTSAAPMVETALDLHSLAGDLEVLMAIEAEEARQHDGIELIASENIASRAVRAAQGSVFTDKYAEGYPERRYYGGCGPSDRIEQLAIDRVRRLFDTVWANVQPHSGASANLAVFFALLQPGDTILGLDLACGGHLTHGSPVTVSGRWFKAVTYQVRRDDERIDYDDLARIARQTRPKLILVGGSAYARRIDFARARAIADEVGAFLMADIAHYAGLIVADLYPNPVPHAHVVTSTTHKTLRGPRGGIILSNEEEIGRRIDKAVFPGIQGGPLMHVIAAKAVAFGEALSADFQRYSAQVIDNAQALGSVLQDGGLRLVTGGTDCHLLLVDVTPFGIDGRTAADALERVGLTVNKNAIPFDPHPPARPSGIRLGTPAATSRGFGTSQFEEVGTLILAVLDGVRTGSIDEEGIRGCVARLTTRHPIER